MKLPTDKKERNQILVLIGIFGVAALYGIYQLTSIYIIQPKADKEEKIAEFTEMIEEADIHIKMMQSNKDAIEAMIQQIKELSDEHVLHARLGNYLLPAKEFIEAHAHAVKANLVSVKEIGITEFPAPPPPKPLPVEPKKKEDKSKDGKKKTRREPAVILKPVAKEYAFKIYTARVSIENGLHTLVQLMRQIEEANPYTCVSAINIVAKSETPDKHDISFDIQWPIWANNKLTGNILSELETQDFTVLSETSDDSETPPVNTASDPNINNSEEMNDQLRELGVPVQ